MKVFLTLQFAVALFALSGFIKASRGIWGIQKLVASRFNSTASSTKNDQQPEPTETKAAPVSSPRRTAQGPFANVKTLYIVMGNLRGGELAWKSLEENVLKFNPNTDLALMIGDSIRPEYQNASLLALAKYYWTFPEYDDWAQAIDTISGTWRQTALPNFLSRRCSMLLGGVQANLTWNDEKGQTVPYFQGSGAVIFMIRYWISLKIERLKLTQVYDRFVITRSDHFYKCEYDLSYFDTCQHIYIPAGEEYGGYTDRHLIVGKQHVLTALDVLPYMLMRPKIFQVPNPERAIMRRWHIAGLFPHYHNRTFFTCAVPGDGTRWKKMNLTRQVPEGVYLKYESEYDVVQTICQQQPPQPQPPLGISTTSATGSDSDGSIPLPMGQSLLPLPLCVSQQQSQTQPDRTHVGLTPAQRNILRARGKSG